MDKGGHMDQKDNTYHELKLEGYQLSMTACLPYHLVIEQGKN